MKKSESPLPEPVDHAWSPPPVRVGDYYEYPKDAMDAQIAIVLADLVAAGVLRVHPSEPGSKLLRYERVGTDDEFDARFRAFMAVKGVPRH